MYAASNIENLLPKDFHNKKMEKDLINRSNDNERQQKS